MKPFIELLMCFPLSLKILVCSQYRTFYGIPKLGSFSIYAKHILNPKTPDSVKSGGGAADQSPRHVRRWSANQRLAQFNIKHSPALSVAAGRCALAGGTAVVATTRQRT